MLKRKLYRKLKEWKSESQGQTALLIDGARRVGKSYLCELFAREEYESYIMIDFADTPTTKVRWVLNYIDFQIYSKAYKTNLFY